MSTTRVPDAVARYLDADARRDTDAIVALFTDDAVVTDEGRLWQGTAEIRGWRTSVASKYQYTTELLGAEATGFDRVLVTVRLEGNFPVGTVELKYRFTLTGDRISQLQIITP